MTQPDGIIGKANDRRRNARWHLLYSFWSKYYLVLISLALLGASSFFFVQVQISRWNTLSNHPDFFSDDDRIRITRVIDGDEFRITNSIGNSRLRLLGVKSFDPTARDLMLSEYGRTCVDFLTTHVLDRNARLKIAKKGIDDQGRLLGKLFVEESTAGAESQSSTYDLGLELVRQGLTLVYTEYPFDGMPEYLAAQEKAESEKAGFWSNRRVSDRARALQRMWTKESQK